MMYLRDNGRRIDTPHFAADLAAALGGKVDDNDNVKFNGENVPDCETAIHGPLLLSLHFARGGFDRIALRLYPDDLEQPYRGQPIALREADLPSITVSVTRPLEQIVRDIKRRLFKDAVVPIAHRRRMAAADRAHKDDTAASAERVRRALPAISVHAPPQYQPDAAPTFSINIDGFYLAGRIQGESVTVDRGSMQVERFIAAMRAALKEGT